MLRARSSLATIACAGFIAGEPCHEKNTAILQPKRPIWPLNHVHCANMKSMGNSSWYTFVDRLHNVTSVFADNMLLTNIPYHTIKMLPNLEILDVSKNKIRKIHKNTFIHNKNFQTLLLSHNNIMLPRKSPFLSSQSLINLYLSNNNIKRVPPIAFTELPSIRALFLDSNMIVKLKPTVFTPLKNLRYLHLGNNRLIVIPPKNSLPTNLVTYITKGNIKRLLSKKRKETNKPIK
ncbi:hypothetical protein MML48_1g15509 [Holotrichia oblita]|uniref:Uncharacterized protein n=1 Tax=Holotrichia oblita TaxID=644536 RepID=A0ACB9TW00_HOLOL|nr:hypothetical protein MML48_1g15509 [Holotrichia oblita]